MYPWCFERIWPSNVVLIKNNCPRYVEVLSLSMICQCTLRIALSPLLKGYRLCTWRALTHDDGNLQKRKSAIKGRYLQTHQPHNICGERNGRPNQRKTQVVVAWKQEKTGSEPATPKQEETVYLKVVCFINDVLNRIPLGALHEDDLVMVCSEVQGRLKFCLGVWHVRVLWVLH